MNFDWNFAYETIGIAFKGLPVTIMIVAIVFFFSFIFGFLVALGRQNEKSILARILSVYVSFIRGTPFMVQAYLFYIAIPTVIQKIIFENNIDFNINVIKGYWYAYILLIFYFTVLMSEMFRGGLKAIDKGQMEAALTVGLVKQQAYRMIILPQVIKHCLPVLCNQITNLVKMSSLAFVFGVPEITAMAKNNASRNLGYVEAYFVIAVFYVLLNLGIELLFKIIEKRATKVRNS